VIFFACFVSQMAKVVPNNHTSLHAYANADEVNETISTIPEFLLEMMACEQGDSLRKGSCTEMIDMTPSQMQCLLDYLQSVSGSDGRFLYLFLLSKMNS
jgi:hypothetical protein